MLRLEQASGAKFNEIPFNGTGQIKIALAGGHVDLAFLAASEVVQPEKEAVPLKVLGQFTKTRGSTMSSVPTTHEEGFPAEMTADRGFAAPRGLPPEIFQRLQKAIEAAMRDPEYIKAAQNDAPFLAYLPGSEWEAEIASERQAYEEAARTMPKE